MKFVNFSFKSFFYIIFFSLIIIASDKISLTEILRDPIGGESECPGGKCHEFVEFANLGPDTFFVKDIFLSDGEEVDSVIPWENTLSWHENCRFNRSFLVPGQFALILDRDYKEAPEGSYFTIADSTTIFTIDASSISGGLTGTKGVFLYRGNRENITDSLCAAIDPNTSVSLNNSDYLKLLAKSPEGFSFVPENILFKPAIFITSPETLSLGRYEFLEDGWICEYKLEDPGQVSQTVICSIAVLLSGRELAKNAFWKVINSKTLMSVESGFLSGKPYPVFFNINLPKDSIAYKFIIEEDSAKTEIHIDISTVWLPPSSVKINEISPRANGDIPEWIELLNTSSMPVNLKGWYIGTEENTNQVSTSNTILGPGKFIILTNDAEKFLKFYTSGIHAIEPTAWQTLNNYRDTVKLINPFVKKPCEVAYYDSDWFDDWNKESVERISLEISGTERNAWALSERPSPGRPNPGVKLYSKSRFGLHIGPIPFTPNGDRKNDLLCIRVTRPVSYTYSIEIYGFNGKKLYEILKPVMEKNYWNGISDEGSPATVGPFFVVATFTSGSDQKRIREKGILWR